MYIIFISSFLIVFYFIKNCIIKKKKNIKRFDYKQVNLFELKDIYFYKNNELVKVKKYNKIFDKPKNLEFNLLTYDYFVIEYLVNNKLYKFLSTSESIKFPLYDDIKNYVYINNISKAELIINIGPKKGDTVDYFKTIDITEELIPFLGPNFTFYDDLYLNMDIKFIINYILSKNLYFIKTIENSDFKLKLYDNFRKEYIVENFLKWNPNLQL